MPARRIKWVDDEAISSSLLRLPKSRRLGYAAAVVCPSAILLLVLALQRGGHVVPLYPLFIFAVMVSALLGGLLPGFLSVCLSLVYLRLILLPHYLNLVGQRLAWMSFVVFAIVGTLMSVVVGALGSSYKALQQSRDRYRSLFESIDEGFCVIEMLFDQKGNPNDWRFLEVNPAFERHTGLKSATGKNIRELAPVVEPRWLDIYAKVAATGQAIHSVEFSQAFRRWFDLCAFRVGEPKQHRVAVLFNNITERMRAEETARRLSAIVESSDEAIIAKNLDGVITSWNRGAQQLYGYSEEEVLGRPASILAAPEHLDELPEMLKRIREGESIEAFETLRMRKDGTVIPVLVKVSPIRDDNGNIVGASSIAHDMTERKLAQEALIRSEKLAAAGRLAATIAHEVNNPLEAVINAVYVASLDPTLTPETRNHLMIADEELRRAAHITRQTLGFYRDEEARKYIALPELIDEVLAMYARKLQVRDIEVHRRYRCAIHCHVEECAGCILVNDGELRQVVSNLVANGMDALPDHGALYVRVSRLTCPKGNGERIYLTIADNGCGIRPENLKRIFEPFFTTKEAVGTGLGLWVIQELVRKHNGSLRLRSRKDRGTVFRLSFPAMPLGSAPEVSDGEEHAVGS